MPKILVQVRQQSGQNLVQKSGPDTPKSQPDKRTEWKPIEKHLTSLRSRPTYAHMLIVVALGGRYLFGFVVITRDHGRVSECY